MGASQVIGGRGSPNTSKRLLAAVMTPVTAAAVAPYWSLVPVDYYSFIQQNKEKSF